MVDSNEVPQTAPLPMDQQLPLIQHEVSGEVVPQRPTDGYINATILCQRAGKLFGHYRENARTQAFLEVLSLDIGIPISKLIEVHRGRGDRMLQGTWVHPQVAISLGQWLFPRIRRAGHEVGHGMAGGECTGLYAGARGPVHEESA